MTDICNVCLKTLKRSDMAILCDHCSRSVHEVISAISSLFFFLRKVFKLTEIHNKRKPTNKTKTSKH